MNNYTQQEPVPRSFARRNPFANVTILQQTFRDTTEIMVSIQIVPNRLYQHHLKCRRPCSPHITFLSVRLGPETRRMEFGSLAQCVFLRWYLPLSHTKRHVWRDFGDAARLRHALNYVHVTWWMCDFFLSAIIHTRRTPRLHIEGTMTSKIYRMIYSCKVFNLFYYTISKDFVLLVDTSSIHRVGIINRYITHIQGHNYKVELSSDMNPIEHASDMVKRLIRQHIPSPTTL